MSHIGEQLIVQKKLGPLETDRKYHYLGRFGEMAKSVLVHFDDKPGAYLIIMKATEFESALDLNLIATAPEQEKLPPWLKRYAGFDLSTLDKQRPTAKRSLASIVDKHLFQITPIVDQTKELFASEDPERELNRAARNCSPKLNESRARLQVLTYLAFGRNKWALMPAYCNVGHPKDMGGSPGRPGEGPAVTEVKAERRRLREAMRKVSCNGYEEFAKLGVFMNEIWSKTLTKKLGCKVQTLASGKKSYYHPAGDPFPSFWKFYRAVIRRFGLETVQLKLYGAARVRHKRATSKGKFSEVVANLVERIEGDAYYCIEVPKGPANGEPMPPLCVVRLRCRTSGMIVGIGFALGKERAEAYRMALFCMAINKVKFCTLFGEKVKSEEWPCEGLPSWATFDRGPGAVKDLIRDFEQRIPIREMTSSWDGQGKAGIESSNPRHVKHDGKPTFVQSELNYVQLARREIRRTIRDNQRIDVMARMTPEMVKARVMPTPLGIWGYLDKRLRTDQHPILFDAAVRLLTTEIEFSPEEDGVYLEGQRFDSNALRRDNQYERLVAGKKKTLRGYAVSLVVRQAWVELGGQLVEIDAMLPLRDHEGQLDLSLRDLAEINRIRAELRAGFSEHRSAVDAEAREEFAEGTGKDWDSGRRKNGRARRGTDAAREEFADVSQILTRKRRKT